MTPSSQSHHSLRILVHDVTDTHRGDHLHQIRCDALEKPAHALARVRLAHSVRPAIIPRGMQLRALRLQSGTQNVERVDDAGAEGARKRTYGCGLEIGQRDGGLFILRSFVASTLLAVRRHGLLGLGLRSRFPTEARLGRGFQHLEGAQVYSCVWEDAEETERETPVECAQAVHGDHGADGVSDETGSSESVGEDLTLHSAERMGNSISMYA